MVSSQDLFYYKTRDGSDLPYRYFESDSDTVLIFLHGITEPSFYLKPLGQFVAERGLATVYLPDLRGYGDNPIRRGDIDYIGQLDDDLEDLVEHIKQRHPGAKIIMGGHSAGGATAIRQTVRPVNAQFSGYLLISPALSPSSPLDRKEKGVNDAKVDVPKIIGLSILNALGFRRWNHAVVYRRITPKERLKGHETVNLSYRLALSRMVGNNYGDYLARLPQPTLVLVAGEDEVFLPEAYPPLYAKHSQAEVQLLAGHGHDDIVQTEQALAVIERWFRRISG